MSNEWEEINIQKKSSKSNNIRLSEWYNGGGCFNCLNGRCHYSDENHCIPYPKELSQIFKNPTSIYGMYDAIKNAEFNWNNIQCTYTVCSFVYSNRGCKNCKEGRIKNFIFKNQTITICYPQLESVKYKITIGMHIDFIIKFNNKKFDVIVYPLDSKTDGIISMSERAFPKSAERSNNDRNSKERNIQMINSIDHENTLMYSDMPEERLIPRKDKNLYNEENYPRLDLSSEERIISPHLLRSISYKDSIELGAKEEYIIPNKKSTQNEYSDNLSEYTENLSEYTQNLDDNDFNIPLKNIVFNMNRKELKINNKYIDIINSYDKNNNVIPELKNFKEDLNKKINEYQSLSKLKFLEIENERLNNDINMMNKKINKLENQISRLNYINNNSSKYEELFKNKKIIESRVTQQFLNTNYSDYVVY
jgi:hypothetical protein